MRRSFAFTIVRPGLLSIVDPRRKIWTVVSCAAAIASPTLACSTGDSPEKLRIETLMDPETCKDCHPDHFREWLGSMHAYAADDPVFLAMNERGQRETKGELGDFCIKCHAPIAVKLGMTTDGLNVADLPQWSKGVTCYFCHNVSEVNGVHNNPLTLASDTTLRGGISDPQETPAHNSAYSSLHDRNSLESAKMCGSCHDIVTPTDLHLERTYKEWLDSFYSDADKDNPLAAVYYGQTCNHCHMPGETGAIANVPGAPIDRRRHKHHFEGIDIALSEFPDAEQAPALQAEQIRVINDRRRGSLCATLCVLPSDAADISTVAIWLHNESSGHAWPSGASQDRRAWLEMQAFRDNNVLFQTGVVADDSPLTSLDDPNLWQFRDWLYDANGDEVHMFWEAHSVVSEVLEVPVDLTADASTWVFRQFEVPSATVDRVAMRVRLRPVGFDVLDNLVKSGDLDPNVRARMQTFSVEPSEIDWTRANASDSKDYGSCVSTSTSCGAPDSL